MRIESLGYFLEIARAGSFSLAARRLFVSQQGLSKSIKALEKELNVTLFERSGKRLHLSDAGRELTVLAQNCIDSHDAIIKSMQKYSVQKDPSKGFMLFVMPFIANGLFNLLNDEMQIWGLKQVIFVEKSLSEILKNLEASSDGKSTLAMIDLSHAMLKSLLHNPELAYEPLFDANIVLVGTKDLLSPRKRSISKAEVSRLPIAYYHEPILESILDDMFAEEPFKNVLMHASNIQFINDLVYSGKAVTFSDTFSAYMQAQESDLLFIPIEDSTTFSVGFIYSTKKGLESPMIDYLNRFKQCIGESCLSYALKFPLCS